MNRDAIRGIRVNTRDLAENTREYTRIRENTREYTIIRETTR